MNLPHNALGKGEAPPQLDPDRDDVARVLAGDTRAFEGIVRRWQGPLVNLAWRYCRDRGRAEEMAQEAFLRPSARSVTSLTNLRINFAGIL